MSKIKTYNIMLSREFPVTHPKAGQETGFRQKVLAALNGKPCYLKKLHTIRANYELWKKRFEEVDSGHAVINLRQWIGRPYRSKTVLIKTLTSKDGIGIQKLEFLNNNIYLPFIDGRSLWYPHEVSENDGLGTKDWLDWFEDYDLSQPFAIIHFTNYRYNR